MSPVPDFPIVDLPIRPPYAPMEARPGLKVPPEGPVRYEPKWDGFRCLAYRVGETIALQSKAGRPLGRYFPELVAAVARLDQERFLIDGEIVIPLEDGSFSFDDLLQRIHPAESRVLKLSTETPARLLLFDILVDGPRLLTKETQDARRAALEAFCDRLRVPAEGTAPATIQLSPATLDRAQALRWLDEKSAKDTDGVVAKERAKDYRAGLRDGMVKIKRLRSIDCVVGGFRRGTKGTVGSLLLGLYGEDGTLDYVGHTSAIAAKERPALAKRLEALQCAEGESFTAGAPGGPSRWNNDLDTTWVPIRPELVIEVQYDHWSGGRFRHGTRIVRWRPDKAPRQCTLDQVKASGAEADADL